MPGLRLPPDFLDLPAERATRLVARQLLHGMVNARERLNDPADAGALHDFRVAVRRMRCWLRAYRRYLHPNSSRQTRRELKRIARAAGTARDAEVLRLWLQSQHHSRRLTHRAASAQLHRRLETRGPAADAALRSALAKHFTRVAHALNSSLAAYSQVVNVDDPPAPVAMAAAAAIALRRDAAALAEAAGHVRSDDDQRAAHRTRIAAKRVRYGLEPFAGTVDGAAPLIRRLTRLQDAIGRWHDACVILDDVVAEADAPGTTHSARSALLALSRRLHREQATGFGIIGHEWHGKRATAFFAAVETIARRLAKRAPPGQEIERKYLLRELPPDAKHAPAMTIGQGYVPGERLVERLRRVRTKGAWRFFRTVKMGTGLTRIEIEEETTAGIFQAMWRLTKGHRIRKRRFTLPAADRTWEIDEFLDRDGLVLAEVELPAADAPADVPDWLAPSVIRDVTGEAKYQNVNLAR